MSENHSSSLCQRNPSAKRRPSTSTSISDKSPSLAETGHRNPAETLGSGRPGGRARDKGGVWMRNGFKVFDADAHVIYPNDLWPKYLDKKYVDRVERRPPPGFDHYQPNMVDGRYTQH